MNWRPSLNEKRSSQFALFLHGKTNTERSFMIVLWPNILAGINQLTKVFKPSSNTALLGSIIARKLISTRLTMSMTFRC